MSSETSTDTASQVAEYLPHLRRYARALTGNQQAGDNYAVAVLEALVEDPSVLDQHGDAKLGLFFAFHQVWSSAGANVGTPDSPLAERAQRHMARLTPNTREALLLHSIEGFRHEDIARIMDLGVDDVENLIDLAVAEMEKSVAGRVLVIEDEAIIAMDVSTIVENLGHQVTGVATTHDEAVALAVSTRPDLVLADIHLADNSSGIDAANDILAQFPETPVIFITAFPERMLTGERPEPAFVINKPYSEEEVRSAVSQAIFFSSVDTLVA